jgi:putative hemolysin
MDKDNKNKDFKPLDIREMFRSKSPGTARWIPGFIYRYLHRALVLDQMNEILEKHGHKKDFDFAAAAMEMFNVRLDVVGKENLPENGRNIFVANHPLGGFDGMMLLHTLGERYDRKIKVLVNDILMNAKNMDGVFVPINKHGGQKMENVKRIDRIFQSDEQVMTFPAGLVSRRKKGVIRDPEWKKSFITKAFQFERDVVPAHITGRCSNFFYNLANLRKFLGIKANLEMFYLPSETFKHRNGHYRITFGKPIDFRTFDKRYKPAEWAEKVKQYTYVLAQDPDATFDVNQQI